MGSPSDDLTLIDELIGSWRCAARIFKSRQSKVRSWLDSDEEVVQESHRLRTPLTDSHELDKGRGKYFLKEREEGRNSDKKSASSSVRCVIHAYLRSMPNLAWITRTSICASFEDWRSTKWARRFHNNLLTLDNFIIVCRSFECSADASITIQPIVANTAWQMANWFNQLLCGWLYLWEVICSLAQ